MALLVVIFDGAFAAYLVGRRTAPPALHRAAWRGDLTTIDREIARGVSPDLEDSSGYWSDTTALMFAARAGQAAAVERLLQHGANAGHSGATADGGRSRLPAVSWAAIGGSVEVLRILIDAGAMSGQPKSPQAIVTPIHLVSTAAQRGHTEAFKWLVDRFGTEALFSANGQPISIALAVQAGELDHLRAVLDASESHLGSRDALAELILKWFANDWDYLLIAAVARGRGEVLQEITERYASGDEWNFLVRVAIEASRDDLVPHLIEFGIQPRCTELRIAIGDGASHLIPSLLAAGADPNEPRCRGNSPLMMAIRRNNLAAAVMLVDAGAAIGPSELEWHGTMNEINWADIDSALVDMVIELGGDLNRRDTDGRTILMRAARAGSVHWVRTLLDRGADPDATDHVQAQAINFAGDPEIRDMLKAAMKRER
ncbi:MAG: ankyrin repeat domain-containing protein [Phycisphaeraceae bacterium]|nr:ankyrin repeat domain-containing protein [Phycisphaeraceae bacterium]